jgi:hypothetical protein
LIILVNFILFIENISKYSKREVDLGKTPHDVYRLCCCIRETFCLSYSIRKENNLYLYFQKEHVLIKFEGKKLRYLGPDERSQALLLVKALNNYKSIRKGKTFLMIDLPQHVEEKVEDFNSNNEFFGNMENDFFIIPIYSISRDNSNIIELFKEVKNIKLISLSKIKEVDNKILYINFRKDQQGIPSKN